MIVIAVATCYLSFIKLRGWDDLTLASTHSYEVPEASAFVDEKCDGRRYLLFGQRMQNQWAAKAHTAQESQIVIVVQLPRAGSFVPSIPIVA